MAGHGRKSKGYAVFVVTGARIALFRPRGPSAMADQVLGQGVQPPAARCGTGKSTITGLSGVVGHQWPASGWATGQESSLTMGVSGDRKSTRLNSSHLGISYAV